jgi:hypothetical protein
VINHIETSCGICALESPTIIFEDNAACVAQMQTGYIKTNYEGPREATGGGVNGSRIKFFCKNWPMSKVQNPEGE